MTKCFRCGSEVYLDDDRIIKCTLCTATNDETGYIAIEHLGLIKLLKLRQNSFWEYYWRHANYSTKWIYSGRDVYIHIDLEDGYYHVEIFDKQSELSLPLDQSWKTLRTAKKWALVYGLNRQWVEENLNRERP